MNLSNSVPVRGHLTTTRLLIASLTALSVWNPAWSDDFALSGFGTVGLACFDANDADYIADFSQPEGPGRSGSCSGGLDSMIGLQLDGNLGDAWSFSLQGISQLNPDGDWDPHIALGLVSWHPSHNTAIRIGRTSNPNFLYSETRNVRFVMPWARPPIEVYALSPFLQFDGIDLLHNTLIGEWDTEIHLGASLSDEDVPINNSSELVDLDSWQVHANIAVQRGPWQGKLGFSGGSYTATSATSEFLHTRIVAPVNASLADDLRVIDADYALVSAGGVYHDKDWLITSEVAALNVDTLTVLDHFGAYLTVARHIGPWTPYVTFAKRWSGTKDDDRASGTFIAPIVNASLDARVWDTKSVAVGVSRALSETAVVKFQVDWVSPNARGTGGYANVAPSFNRNHPEDNLLFSLSLDFLF